MKKFIIPLATILVFLFFAQPVSAICPSEINDTDISIIGGNTCTIPAGYTYILDKVSSETSSTNTAQLSLTGGSLTIANTAILRTATLIPNGGSIIIQNGGSIIIGGTTGTGLWVTDADADGYAANFTTYTATAAGRRRLGLMKSKTVADCLDSNIARWQNFTGYTDADSDGYGTGGSQQVCSGASLLAGYTASSSVDCNDANANIRTKNATGGTQSFISGYIVHSFTSSGTFTITCGGATTVDYLVVAGGGSGGTSLSTHGGSGGGGAGGMLTGSIALSQSVGYSATVGAGGAALGANTGLRGNNGANSIFHNITTIGGGGGGAGKTNASPNFCLTGGSGGGMGWTNAAWGGSQCVGTSGQGNSGGQDSGSGNEGAGGGGKGGAGGYATGSGYGGTGGVGSASSITGSSITYSTGGVGGDTTATGAINGAANTGNGGNGAYAQTEASGAGGSGVVIVRYANP